MNLGKFIHTLLSDHETVIIPEFGAFVSKYKPAEIGETEIKPPSKEISFTTQIRNNDGLLVEAVARKRKISLENALIKIEKERENILFKLDKGERVIFEMVGEIFYDAQNELQFTPESNYLSFADEFGFGIISTEDLPEEPDEPILLAEEVYEPQETLIEPGTIELTEVNQEEPLNTEIEEVEIPLENNESEIIAQAVAENNIADKKKRSKSVLWLLFVIPLAFAVYFFVQKKNIPTSKFELEVVPDDALNTENDFISHDTLLQPDTTLNIAQEQALQAVAGNYYLVGGGFKSEENAEKYILQLKETGIEGINLGKRGNLHLVGIGSFATEKEAYKALNEYAKSNPDWSLWVYKK